MNRSQLRANLYFGTLNPTFTVLTPLCRLQILVHGSWFVVKSEELLNRRHNGRFPHRPVDDFDTDTWGTQSKQYLTTHTIEDAHLSDIFAVAPTQKFLFSGSGGSEIKIHCTATPDYPLLQTIEEAHKLGTHHLAAAANGLRVASAGFGGEVKIWKYDSDKEQWVAGGTVHESTKNVGELWAVALTAEGHHLIASAYDGRVCVWDIRNNKDSEWEKLVEHETKGSFGMSIAVVKRDWKSFIESYG